MEKIGTALLLRRTGAMLRLVPVSALVAWLAMALPMALLDATAEGSGRMAFVSGLIAMFAQFIVTGKAARRAGLVRDRAPGRVGSYVLFSILSGLAITLGFCALVLPGLYLFARWSIGVPIIVIEAASMGEAMSESWDRTRSLAVPICLALVVVGSALAAATVGQALLTPEYGPTPPLLAIVGNLAVYGSMLLTWLLALAIYELTAEEQTPDLEQVFA